MRIYIENANGHSICIARREGVYRLSKLDVGAIEETTSASKVAFGDGYYVQEDALFLGSRSITIGFSNYADTTTDFVRALNPKYMVDMIFEDKGIRRRIRGKVQGTPVIARDRTKQVEFKVICYEPFFYEDGKNRIVEKSAVVNNGGDIACPVKITVTGKTISSSKGISPIIKNETSGFYLEFESLSLFDGDVLEMNGGREFRSIVITRSDGSVENGYNYLVIADYCRLFELLPGKNVISCTYNDEEHYVTLKYSEMYMDWGVVV